MVADNLSEFSLAHRDGNSESWINGKEPASVATSPCYVTMYCLQCGVCVHGNASLDTLNVHCSLECRGFIVMYSDLLLSAQNALDHCRPYHVLSC